MNHLLVVDDSSQDRLLAGTLLERNTRHLVEFASNGLEALEQLEQRLPLAIVTDMKMPEMDGLALVEAVRRQFPQVPVILMTGHGSEEIALQALLAGAADFVNKSRLTQDLVLAVAGVLTVSGPDRSHQRLSHCLRYEEVRFELENDLHLIPSLVSQLQASAAEMGVVDPTDGIRLARALAEGIRNAICHGNLELPPERPNPPDSPAALADAEVLAQRRRAAPYCDRHVHVAAVMSPQEVRITIRDEGPGFDPRRVPDARVDPACLTSRDGRGLVMMRTFMDEIHFNARGNEVTLVKRAGKHQPEALARG